MAQQREARLVNEWLKEFHPTALQWRRVRLGAIPGKETAGAFKVLLRWADAVFVENDTVYILEAKIRPDAGTIGQLEHYIELFPRTPEFLQFHDLPVKGILLSAWEDIEIARRCMVKDIVWEYWQPDWIKPYLEQRFKIRL